MPSLRAAIFDLGSNSIKILLAEQRASTLYVHHEAAHTTRLGNRLALTGRLSPRSIKETLSVLQNARIRAEAFGAESLHVVGTSALRSATNAPEFLLAARKVLGQSVRVISGAYEARYAYAGISSSRVWSQKKVLALDLGGGSLEFVIGEKGRLEKGRSVPVGCVRLHDLFMKRQPVSAHTLAEAREWILKTCRSVLPWTREPGTTLVGCGGTMITLAALHLNPHKKIFPLDCEGTLIPTESLESILRDLAPRPLASIRRLGAVPASRADVITAGALVFHTIARAAGARRIGCATLGLRYGLWQSEIAPQPFRRVVYETSPV